MARHGLKLSRLLMRARRILRNDQLILSVLALAVGLTSGLAVAAFRKGITWLQGLTLGAESENLYQTVAQLPWWQVLLVPALAGLIVGLWVHRFLPGRRPHGVADVIEASALKGGRMSIRDGFHAAVASLVSIGGGASVGREGPAVHIGGALGGWIARRLHLTRSLSRALLGCGVAAAVAASFNAPIAGALFASEVVIGHYALSAFAPVVIASVAGSAVCRAIFGDFPAFFIPEYAIQSWWEFPAFAGLGILCGVVALMLLSTIRLVQDGAARMPGPTWLRPAAGGLAVGAIAVLFPQVLGVGYGVTDSALAEDFGLALLFAIGAAKMLATALSLGSGMAGGIFSPALVIGAMAGGVYGVVVTELLPHLSSGQGAYSLVGMGAVAAAVLGAPISTTLIIFEMTRDYAITMAVMVAVVLASVVSKQAWGGSFFEWQLERRGLDLKRGYETALMRGISVDEVMTSKVELVTLDVKLPELRAMLQGSEVGELFVVDGEGELFGTITLADLSETAFDPLMDDLINAGDVARRRPPMLALGDTLDDASKLFKESGESPIAVVRNRETPVFLGCVHERDAMNAYNRALVIARREEHD